MGSIRVGQDAESIEGDGELGKKDFILFIQEEKRRQHKQA